MLTIDGSQGEGGGQILRSSLALSLLTEKPIKLVNIRAGRKKPGLMRQHLTAVNAAAQVGHALVRGNALGSRQVYFEPKGISCGVFDLSVGTAGSCTLVLQTVLPALLVAAGPSELTLRGGTHNPFAPPFDFLSRTFLPLIARMGPKVSATLNQTGFYPAGGGMMTVRIDPSFELSPIELIDRGPITTRKATAKIARLPEHIAKRELDIVAKDLKWPRNTLFVEHIHNSQGPGNALVVEVGSKAITEVFTGFGKKGVPAEEVARKTCLAVNAYLDANVPVGQYLADQLLIPLAMAGGGVFRTLSLTSHTKTNMEIVKNFLPVDIETRHLQDNCCEVRIQSKTE